MNTYKRDSSLTFPTFPTLKLFAGDPWMLLQQALARVVACYSDVTDVSDMFLTFLRKRKIYKKERKREKIAL